MKTKNRNILFRIHNSMTVSFAQQPPSVLCYISSRQQKRSGCQSHDQSVDMDTERVEMDRFDVDVLRINHERTLENPGYNQLNIVSHAPNCVEGNVMEHISLTNIYLPLGLPTANDERNIRLFVLHRLARNFYQWLYYISIIFI